MGNLCSTPLEERVYEEYTLGEIELAGKLLSENFESVDDINAIHKQLKTLLHHFCEDGELEMVKKILRFEEIDVNKIWRDERKDGAYVEFSPLLLAIKSNHMEIVELLLGEKEIRANQPYREVSPLVDLDVVNGYGIFIEEEERSVGRKIGKELTPLQFSILNNRREISFLLLEDERVELSFRNICMNPLFMAIEKEDEELVSRILKRIRNKDDVRSLFGISSFDFSQKTALIHAIDTNNSRLVDRIIETYVEHCGDDEECLFNRPYVLNNSHESSRKLKNSMLVTPLLYSIIVHKNIKVTKRIQPRTSDWENEYRKGSDYLCTSSKNNNEVEEKTTKKVERMIEFILSNVPLQTVSTFQKSPDDLKKRIEEEFADEDHMTSSSSEEDSDVDL